MPSSQAQGKMWHGGLSGSWTASAAFIVHSSHSLHVQQRQRSVRGASPFILKPGSSWMQVHNVTAKNHICWDTMRIKLFIFSWQSHSKSEFINIFFKTVFTVFNCGDFWSNTNTKHSSMFKLHMWLGQLSHSPRSSTAVTLANLKMLIVSFTLSYFSFKCYHKIQDGNVIFGAELLQTWWLNVNTQWKCSEYGTVYGIWDTIRVV